MIVDGYGWLNQLNPHMFDDFPKKTYSIVGFDPSPKPVFDVSW
jgi:hypothetical protein